MQVSAEIWIDGLWDSNLNVDHQGGDLFHCIFVLNREPFEAWWDEFDQVASIALLAQERGLRIKKPDKIGIDMNSEDMSDALEFLVSLVRDTNEKYAATENIKQEERAKEQRIIAQAEKKEKKIREFLKTYFDKG